MSNVLPVSLAVNCSNESICGGKCSAILSCLILERFSQAFLECVLWRLLLCAPQSRPGKHLAKPPAGSLRGPSFTVTRQGASTTPFTSVLWSKVLGSDYYGADITDRWKEPKRRRHLRYCLFTVCGLRRMARAQQRCNCTALVHLRSIAGALNAEVNRRIVRAGFPKIRKTGRRKL